jgi:hypothetical protein
MRPGRSLATCDADLDENQDLAKVVKPTVTICGTLAFVKGKGFCRQPWTKTDAGYRKLTPIRWADRLPGPRPPDPYGDLNSSGGFGAGLRASTSIGCPARSQSAGPARRAVRADRAAGRPIRPPRTSGPPGAASCRWPRNHAAA